MSHNLLENLNQEQVQAVMHTSGPLMIIAGAGTGKTTVITQRIAWLIEQGYARPDGLLALTFTEKAALEMEERVDQLLPIGYVDLWISTFHAFCERILREHALDIGLPHEFRLLDQVDTYLLVRKHFDRFALDYYAPRANPSRFIEAMLTHFSRLKDEMISPERYLAFAQEQKVNTDSVHSDIKDAQTHEADRLKELAQAYHTYQQVLLEKSCLDFADLISYTIELFQKRPAILQKYRDQFKYVLVDEFQDTNSAQYELIKLLINEEKNITVVGDDDQSIYKFRGASLSNIMQFSIDFPHAKHVVLTRNYRSAGAVLDHAYTLIQHNNPHRLEAREGINKQLTSHIEQPGRVVHIHAPSLDQELLCAAAKMQELHINGYSWGEMAVLVRANAHAEPLVDVLEQLHIPYRFMALSGLYAKPMILDALSWMRVVDLPYNSPALYRILNHPASGVGSEDLVKLTLYSKRKTLSLFEALEQTPGLCETSKQAISDFLSTLHDMRQAAKQRRASEMFVYLIRETWLQKWILEQNEGQQRELNTLLQTFFERIRRFETHNEDKYLHNFLEEFEEERLSGEAGALSQDPTQGPDIVQIMTVHAAKGLEFRAVFLINMVDQRFPSQRRAEPIPLPDGLLLQQPDLPDNEHEQEERRLFYVAMTRAKEHLYLLSADDYGGSRKRKPSRFLRELNIKPTHTTIGDLLTQTEKIPENKEQLLYTPEQKTISFTQIQAFSTCPLQYKFAHILHIPVFGRYPMSYGKSMHKTLELFTKEYIQTNTIQQTSLLDPAYELQKPSIPPYSRMLELYEQSWIDEWYPDQDIKSQYYQQGKESLKYLHEEFTNTRPQIAYLEQGFSLKIADQSIKGRIDRIDGTHSDGFEIIDYKTGKPKYKLEWREKKQLVLYALAAERCFNPPLQIEKVTYCYLEDASRYSFTPTQKDRQKLVNEVSKIREEMAMSSFKATPGFHCSSCDFKEICEFRDT